jgi:hypothetical protein
MRALSDNLQAPHSMHGLSHVAAAWRSTADLRSGSKLVVKSLFQNILPVSPCGSTFCQDQAVSLSPKSLEINNLEQRAKKMRGLSTRERAEQQS